VKTPEGEIVIIGQQWRSLDPRRPRSCTIIGLDEKRKRVRFWRAINGGYPWRYRTSWVSVRCMKHSHTGWEKL